MQDYDPESQAIREGERKRENEREGARCTHTDTGTKGQQKKDTTKEKKGGCDINQKQYPNRFQGKLKSFADAKRKKTNGNQFRDSCQIRSVGHITSGREHITHY